MDFAVVQAPSINTGYSTFETGRTQDGHLLFIYGSGNKVMIFDADFQLVQLLRTFSKTMISAVSFGGLTGIIAAAYDETVELFELTFSEQDSEESEHRMVWKRVALISTGFPVYSLAWSRQNVLAVAGSKLALYMSAHIHSLLASTSSSRLDSSTWIQLLSQSLPSSSHVDRLQFSPNGRHLATFESASNSCLMKVWTFADFDQPVADSEDLVNLLGRPFYQNIERLCGGYQMSSFCYLSHDEPIAGFAWSPLAQFKEAHVLLTWTVDGMFTVWAPEFSRDVLYGDFHIIRSLRASSAWFEPEYPIRLSALDKDGVITQYSIENLENLSRKLVEFVSSLSEVSFEKAPNSIKSRVERVDEFFIVFDPSTNMTEVLGNVKDENGQTHDANSFHRVFYWTYTDSTQFPLQIISPFSAFAASVFAGSKNILDVCFLGSGCQIIDYHQSEFSADITGLQWVSTGHVFLSTTNGCFAIKFEEGPLREVQRISVHDRDDLQFIGICSGRDLAYFWDRSANLLYQYRMDFISNEARVLETIKLENTTPLGFLQILDCDDGPHLIAGTEDLSTWRHYDLLHSGSPETIHQAETSVRFARTSIFGDIALVSSNSRNTDSLTIITPTAYEIHSDDIFCEEHDTILAIKWVIIDHEKYIRHLVACSTTGIVIYVASLNEEFKETWHSIDYSCLPETLSPPVPLGPTAISCNKYFDIWVTIDDMIVMWAPVAECPLFDALRNAMEPSAETFATSELFTELYSILLDPNGASERQAAADVPKLSPQDLMDTISVSDRKDDFWESRPDKYDFLFLDEGSVSRNSSIFDLPHTESPASSQVIFDDLVNWTNLDGPARKFLVLNRTKSSRSLNVTGLDFLCAYQSDAQDALINECNNTGSLFWASFDGFGFAFWVKNKQKLIDLTESMARSEYSNSTSLETISLFYLLIGKRRALQALWKAAGSCGSDHANARIGQFLHHDFSQESNRLVASKNAYASLSKQRNRLAIMFFLLAEQYKDALLVALDSLKDASLAMLIARLTGNEELLAELLQDRTIMPLCCKGILESLIGRSEDVIGTCLELFRAAPWNDSFACLPILTSIKLPVRHRLTPKEAERSMQILLRQGAFTTARQVIALPHLDHQSELKCHLSLLRLTSSMTAQRWDYLKDLPKI